MASSGEVGGGSWWRQLSRYHWFVIAVAGLGWLFDCLDQQIFNLARAPAVAELLGPDAGPGAVDEYGGYATSIFLLGWGAGGLVFGVLGDVVGRAKVMVATILLYSLCTGLSALSTAWWDFAVYRFLTGLGVGGEFAVGAALVAEVIPARARPHALAIMQSCSTVGNMLAAGLAIALAGLQHSGAVTDVWRILFAIGAAPALLSVLIRRRLREPERWQEARRRSLAGEVRLGSYRVLFGDRRWRRHALVGLMLACPGVLGLWGIGFFSFDLLRSVLEKSLTAEGLSGDALRAELTLWTGVMSLMMNGAGFLGMLVFGAVAERIGRRPTFAGAFVLAAASTLLVFGCLATHADIFWMVPLMGFFQLSLFAGYAIYLPELFPTYLRSTGTSFCYNVSRFAAAAGPLALGLLSSRVFAASDEPLRPAGMVLCSLFALGLAALPFAPETRGKQLPE